MDCRQPVLWTLLITIALIESTYGWGTWQAVNARNSYTPRQYVGSKMADANMNSGAFNVGRKYYIGPHVDGTSYKRRQYVGINNMADDNMNNGAFIFGRKYYIGPHVDRNSKEDESHEGSGEQTKPLPTVPSQQTSSTEPSSSQTGWHSESQHTVVVSTTVAPITSTTSQTQQPDEFSVATEIPVSTETPKSVKVSTSTLTSTEIQQPVEVSTTAATTLENVEVSTTAATTLAILEPGEFSTEAAESINVPTVILASTETHQLEDSFTSAAPTSETVQSAEVSTTIMPLEPETEQQLFEVSTSEVPSAATTSRVQPVETSTTTPLVITSTETLPLWKLIQRRIHQVKDVLRKPVTYY